MNIGQRLKEERERIGMSQTEFASVASASKHAQINWEKGETTPNANALAAWAAIGLDVLYVVTGLRAGGHEQPVEADMTRTAALSAEHQELITHYDGSSPNDQAAIRQLARSVSRQRAAKAVPSGSRKTSSK